MKPISQSGILFIGLWLLRCVFPEYTQAQSFSISAVYPDTISIRLREADSLFQVKNLSLIAQRYQIDAAQASVWQAKLWPNPNISITQGGFDPQTRKWFDLSSSGETALQLQQLILLAGKRNKQIQLARTNVALNQYSFFDLLRTLAYTLHQDFYQLYFLQRSLILYQQEIDALMHMVDVLKQQYARGFVAQKEVLRVQAQVIDLKSQYQSVQAQIANVETELGILLQDPNSYYKPVLDSQYFYHLTDIRNYALADLIDSALSNRADIHVAEANLRYSQQNYSLQKALAIPDLTLGVGYDKNGSYVHNANFLSAAIDLPFFNRNQGNIQAAKSIISYQQAQLQQAQQTVIAQVRAAYQQALAAQQQYQSIDSSFYPNFAQLLQEVNVNYQRRNISLLEFLDFYDAYKQSVLDYQQALLNKILSIETLNYVIGRRIFR
ncbi:MAG: TolC family protein [Thermoflavifilum sp.]|nr:TolC family protein [Thermoflavifilum sp.]